MFVKVTETRHTKIGTLRTGTILDVAQLGRKGSAVIEALLAQENPALKKLTKNQVEAEKDAVVSLEPKAGPEDKTSIDLDVLEGLQETLSEAKSLNTGLQDDLKAMTDYRDELTKTAVSESKRADAAEASVKALQVDLEKAQKALTVATAKPDGDGK